MLFFSIYVVHLSDIILALSVCAFVPAVRGSAQSLPFPLQETVLTALLCTVVRCSAARWVSLFFLLPIYRYTSIWFTSNRVGGRVCATVGMLRPGPGVGAGRRAQSTALYFFCAVTM